MAAVADNALNLQAASKLVTDEHNKILPVPCCTHLLSFMMSDAIRKTTIGQLALSMIDRFVQKGDLRRYSITRWTWASRFDAMRKAIDYL